MIEDLFPAHVESILAEARRIIAELGYDQLVLYAGAPTLYAADDQEIIFRPHPHFKRFVPINSPHHILVIAAHTARVIEVLPEDFWEEKGGDDEFWKSAYDVTVVATEEKAWELVQLTPKTAFVGERTNITADPKVTAALDHSRSLKTPYEVACIEEANKRAAPGHVAARDAFMGGASELDIHFAFLKATHSLERDLPYPTIVGLNEKGSILHYQRKRTDVTNAKTFLIDAGVSYRGYASDISRTYTTESAHPVFKKLVTGLDALQQELVAAVRPDMHFIELHHEAHIKIAALLKSLNIITVDGEDAVKAEVTRVFMPHGLGHMLGIQVHDVGAISDEGMKHPLRELYPKVRTNRMLVTGNVTTIEPGIYFIPMLLDTHRTAVTKDLFNWSLIDELIPCGGIRVEDNIVVTMGGPVNLTRKYLPN